ALRLPASGQGAGRARLRCSLWWDIAPDGDALRLEGSPDGGATWWAVPFTTAGAGAGPREHPTGSVSGWSGRVWHRLTADLPAWSGGAPRLRWRYTTERLATGRGVYVNAIRVEDRGRTVFDEARPRDAARIEADGWTASRE
ncbi:serine hydrolase, partial [Streptomyces sp. NPDC004726]